MKTNDRSITIRNGIKFAVYTLLLLNFGHYFFEEWRNAEYTLEPGASLLEWTSAYVTTFDEITIRPFGLDPMCRKLAKSTLTIIG